MRRWSGGLPATMPSGGHEMVRQILARLMPWYSEHAERRTEARVRRIISQNERVRATIASYRIMDDLQ